MVRTFHFADLDSADAVQLLTLHFDAMRAGSPPDACHVLPIDGLRHADISFWSLRQDGRLLGVGALKELSGEHGEVKFMRTAPEALGLGVGTAMLHHLVEEAERRRYRRLSLETGSTEMFAAAIRLYEREGFRPCGAFGNYRDSPFTRFFTRELAP